MFDGKVRSTVYRSEGWNVLIMFFLVFADLRLGNMSREVRGKRAGKREIQYLLPKLYVNSPCSR